MLKSLILKLACAHPKNREWIMSQLSSKERGLVQLLLNEVKELGLDKDVATIQAVISEHEDSLRARSSSHVEGIENLDPFWRKIMHGQSMNDSTAKTDIPLAAPPQLSAALMSIAGSESS